MNNFEKVREALVKTLACEESAVTIEATIIDDLGADSLAMVELIMALEDAFGLTITEEAAAEIMTVGDIVALIDARS